MSYYHDCIAINSTGCMVIIMCNHKVLSDECDNTFTNMECRFPAMLVSCLGREFYRSMYRNSGGMKPLTPDVGDKMCDLKNSRIFLISLLGAEIRISPDDSM
ncbi:hypothetical protein AVEN_59618-1 [Araneus ventricosus]|uniref:Uncharacterized protein n=1 Tax=Araneus ventricosus TaxID=182803 RepID=A0A4Y2N6H7_ARAVE|nr:hypothetical protein AVEN_59618-1 [Araneus ventricosus]